MAHVLVQKLQKGILHATHAQLRDFEVQMPKGAISADGSYIELG
jgi:hypothetical protein